MIALSSSTASSAVASTGAGRHATLSTFRPGRSTAASATAPFTTICPSAPQGRISTRYAARTAPVRALPQRTVVAAAAASQSVPDASVSVVLLAGGVGKRMGASIPKQYLELRGQPIATYSLETFAKMKEVFEIVIVCDPSWREVFENRFPGLPKTVAIKWALPGAERQDSVFNGLQEIAPTSELVAIHDSARPCITAADTRRCFLDGMTVGAAVLGVPVKPTIKEVDADMNVIKTLQRSKLWEVQTPQVIRPALLREGFDLVKRDNLEVTDDVSIIEAMGKPVKITSGSYTNIKITTPEDMSVGAGFLEAAEAQAKATAVAA